MPVGKLLGRPPKRPPRWRRITQWRDWSLPVKLGAVTLVPILIALILGVATIGTQIDRSGSYQRMDRLASLMGEVRTTVDALQRERTRTAELLLQGTVQNSPELAADRTAVDAAVGPFRQTAERASELDAGVGSPAREAGEQLDRLAVVRQQLDAGQLDAEQVITEYSTVVDSVLKVDTAAVSGLRDDAIGGTPNAQHDLQVAKEEVSSAQALVGSGIAKGTLTPAQLNTLRTTEVRLDDRLADFRAAATQSQRQDFDAGVVGPNLDARRTMVESVLGDTGATPEAALRQLSAQQWTDASAAVATRIGEVSARMGERLKAVSSELFDEASTVAGVLAVLLFGALVVAAAVVFLITRQLLRSLRVLRASALDVANRQLPAAVQNIQEGRPQSTDAQPVPVASSDEVGEVARAFDAVHSQALRLAVEQAAMRTGYSSVFVNLSRRSQSLVQRQLQLIERLERDEEDADQLATLFQLDHLATRMRRNNENLMVLSGADPARRSGRPVTTADVLRAAVSEIEQYQRVTVQPPPQAKIVGHAAGDLMRLIAELLDNATAFSAPETMVTVVTSLAENKVLSVDILDKGIGMNSAEVAEANVRLTEAASVDLATSRRMGLFVVGRLASRHGIGVTLHGGKDIVGVRATVTVPAELVMDVHAPAGRPQPQPAKPGELPKRPRVNGATGVSHPGVLTTPVPPQRESTDSAPKPPKPPQAPPPTAVEVSGTALFSPLTDEISTPPEETPESPESSEELPSGKELFASANGSVLGEWWNTETRTPPDPDSAYPETTPIFDATISAWFRAGDPEAAKPAPPEKPEKSEKPEKPEKSEKPEAETADVEKEKAEPAEEPETAEAQDETPEPTAAEWSFPADVNWRTVREVSAKSLAEPANLTPAGLPRRRKGERLLPGTAEPVEAATGKVDLPVRDPAVVRGRLSSFQQGVTRARQEAKRATETPEPPAEAPEKPSEPSVPPQPETALEQTAEWSFADDENWQTAQAVAAKSQAVPSSFTASGLPRRRRGERLMPGSAAGSVPAGTPAVSRTERDAEDVRGRLSSFQQGVRRGRHRTGKATEDVRQTVEGE
ncbi:nitrate- and nitrite sensing domain-containing protein [Amycolatopsis suaedae]|uniref:histidine kinase n=1 Tax=Amycolatopsis suaedae TaxID=2510978 RepID=A0A4Q7J8N3_9PSEU|nr:nitrate- and nitrite sensing domain-containing protein [Amycolatopsis suaedae]RZQ63276.1 HAMP domain-containing protein [Amycolatopsis suaedae]